MSYSIDEIRLAANKWVELPGMDVEERSLWYSLGYWYEEYRNHRKTLEECEEAAAGYINHFVLVKRGDKSYDLRFRRQD